MGAIYVLELTPDEVSAIEFARGRYGWATALAQYLDDVRGAVMMTESEAWFWQEQAESDDSLFPLAAPAFANKLHTLLESIV